MNRMMLGFVIAICLTLPLNNTIRAQAPESTPQSGVPSEQRNASMAGLRGRVIEIRSREASDLVPVLRPLLSGAFGTVIEASRELRTITVRDYPENIAIIEEAIKRLDVPRPSRPLDPDVELTMHVLIASNDEEAAGDYPTTLRDVVTQLKRTFNYRGYRLLTPILHRDRITDQNITLYQGNGNTTYQMTSSSKTTNITYKYGYHQISLESAPSGTTAVFIRGFRFAIDGKGEEPAATLGDATIFSNLSIRDGEKLVVGSASLRDRAVIVVISAMVAK